jgi:hypothetical protein
MCVRVLGTVRRVVPARGVGALDGALLREGRGALRSRRRRSRIGPRILRSRCVGPPRASGARDPCSNLRGDRAQREGARRFAFRRSRRRIRRRSRLGSARSVVVGWSALGHWMWGDCSAERPFSPTTRRARTRLERRPGSRIHRVPRVLQRAHDACLGRNCAGHVLASTTAFSGAITRAAQGRVAVHADAQR